MISGSLLRTIMAEAVDPFHPENLDETSLDVTLADTVYRQRTPHSQPIIDLADPPDSDILFEKVSMASNKGEYLMRPGEFVKGRLQEYIKMPRDMAAMFSLRSCIAQTGLEQSTSVWIRPEWEGNLVLELTNFSNKMIRLSPGLRIGQLHFLSLKGY